MIILNVSVHDIVDLMLRSGDIDNRVFNSGTMQEGTRLHALYQQSKQKGYYAEYPLSYSIEYKGYQINISGKADGVIFDKDKIIVEEIKTTVEDLNIFHQKNKDWHLGQALVYAFIISKSSEIEQYVIRLVYISQIDDSKTTFEFVYFKKEIEDYFYSLLNKFLDFNNVIKDTNSILEDSLRRVSFPFTIKRKNQNQIMLDTYDAIDRSYNLLIQAPTGSGKTISFCYPAIKQLGKKVDKVFYLTAKTAGSESVKKVLQILKDKDLKMKSVIIYSKDNICPYKEHFCNPDKCEYAKDYYNKLVNILVYCLKSQYDIFDLETTSKIAYEFKVCPFELQLDLSLFASFVVCDYNYIFDPFVKLQRFSNNPCSNFALLIDETHNMVSRSRGMYSADLSLNDFYFYKKHNKTNKNKDHRLILNKIIKYFKEDIDEYENEINDVSCFNKKLLALVAKFILVFQKISKNEPEIITQDYKELFFKCNRFVKINELADDNFVKYISIKQNNISYVIFCVNPTPFISHDINSFNSCVAFSATLTPMNYFATMIFNDCKELRLNDYPTVFNRKQINILINDKISLNYKDRENSIDSVVDCVFKFINSKLGNYILFVPSYEYLKTFKAKANFSDCDVFYQEQKMNANDKLNFINNLSPNPTKNTLCVAILGGVFSESIDLVGDKLIGVIVLGVGYPMISFENEKIRSFYDEKNNKGRLYAYVYPGMNNVTQAIGRLIRDENDRGSALLIDQRYGSSLYKNLFPDFWKNYKTITYNDDIIFLMNNFNKSK